MKISYKKHIHTLKGLKTFESWLDECFKLPKQMPMYEMSDKTKKILKKIADDADRKA